MKIRALVDVDGVVCDFIQGYLGIVKQVTGKSFKHSDVTDWSFKKCLGLTDAEERIANQLMCHPGFVRSLSALPGAYEGITALKEKVDEIVFVTAAWQGHPTWAHEREEWLNERWPGCHIVSTHHKNYVRGDFLVDDKPSHIEAWKNEWIDEFGGTPRTFLIDAPYNREYDADIRAHNLREVAACL